MKRLIALALLNLSGPALAQNEAVDEVARTLMFSALDFARLSEPAGRADLVEAVRLYCVEVDRVFPKNSPAEEAWLDEELKGGGERIMRALGSAEFSRRSAKSFTEDCLSYSISLVQEADFPQYYTGLAYTFVRFQSDAESIARKNNVDAKRYAFDVLPRRVTQALLIASMNSYAQRHGQLSD